MTAKEKSNHLYLKYLNLLIANYDLDGEDYLTKAHAKQCAIIACQEVIDCLKDDSLYADGENSIRSISKYWQEVKNELNQL
jgi:hypothetical protein